MMIKDILQRDPATHPLVNLGHARIADLDSTQTLAELRGELSVFVCEGEYANGIEKIIRSFLDNLDRTSQRAAWVSGFFGSGKSHFLKMLSHLWQDTKFPDGVTARSLVPSIPEELRALLRELDVARKRAGGVLAAAGSLPGGTTDNVRLTIVGILLNATGLPEQYPQARFCLWLHSLGCFDRVKSIIEHAGRSFSVELNDLYVSARIAQAVMEVEPNFANSEAEAKQLLKAQFPPKQSDISSSDFLRTVKEALQLRSGSEGLPCTLLILDEVQQYIGDSNDRSVLVTEVTEAVSKQLGSRVMVVGAGQSALTDAPLLQRLMDRFTIRVQLSDTEVETVTRKVLLQKKASEIPTVRSLLDKHAGEVSRQLQGTRVGEVSGDRAFIVDDYPLLPVRRRFWEHCFRQIDAAGTQSQLRSQLRIIHDAVAKLSSRPLGALVPGDELFDALAPEMVNTGVLLREINERIIHAKQTHGPLAQRICGLVFLISRLKRDGGVDTGIRATPEHISDLLIDDLSVDNSILRNDVESMLRKLVEDGTLMAAGDDEYRLQTRESSEWERVFKNRRTKITGDDAAVQFKREQILHSEIGKRIRGIRIVQGSAKEPRKLIVHSQQDPPVIDGTEIPIWIRDGWSCSEKDVVDAARAAGSASAVLFAFISRQSADDLRRLIVEADAAQQTLDEKGNPATAEGQEARQSMDSRRASAAASRDALVREIVANVKVYQGGGSELLNSSLEERIRDGVDASLIRLFPRFKEADSRAWEAAIKHARDGADHPLKPTGYNDATEKHPVCQQVLSTAGNGRSGSDVRRALSGAPYGWPQDAVDAALIALHRSQHIAATLNGAPIAPGQLDQNKIAKTQFRVEQTTLSVQDRLVVRKLFQMVEIRCDSGDESASTPEFFSRLIALAAASGGEPPQPKAPSVADIEDIRRLAGNEQLLAVRDKAGAWEADIKSWRAYGDLIERRLPTWLLVERLAIQAASVPVAKPALDQLVAVREQRLLLEASDPVSPLRVAIAGALREHVQKAYEARCDAVAAALGRLESNSVWNQVSSADQKNISSAVGLVVPTKAQTATDEALATYLEQNPLSSLQAEIDAIPGRLAQAIQRAAKLLEPKVQIISIERSTLRSVDDVDLWLERQKATLVEAVRFGPVLVN